MKPARTWIAALALLSLAACSSRPRDFVPTLASAPADRGKYEADYSACRTMVAQGQRSGFGARLASGGLGMAAGVGATAATLGGTYGSMAAAGAAMAASAVMLPVVGVAAAWGVAKAQKSKKERAVKEAMALCLSEGGYSVADWEVAKKKKKQGARTASRG